MATSSGKNVNYNIYKALYDFDYMDYLEYKRVADEYNVFDVYLYLDDIVFCNKSLRCFADLHRITLYSDDEIIGATNGRYILEIIKSLAGYIFWSQIRLETEKTWYEMAQQFLYYRDSYIHDFLGSVISPEHYREWRLAEDDEFAEEIQAAAEEKEDKGSAKSFLLDATGD